jgi:hypothetical protein
VKNARNHICQPGRFWTKQSIHGEIWPGITYNSNFVPDSKKVRFAKKVGYIWKFFDESDKMEYFTNPDECATLTPERNLCGTLQGRDGRGGAP